MVQFKSIVLLVGDCVRALSSGIQKRVSMRFRLQRVFVVKRAGRGNNMSSEPIETCSMGHDEEDCVDRMFEVQQRISSKDNKGAFHYCRSELYCRRETAKVVEKSAECAFISTKFHSALNSSAQR